MLSEPNATAQYLYDIGFGGGRAGYSGELSNNPFTNPGYSVGGFYRNNINSRFAARLDLDYGKVSANSENVTNDYLDAQGVCYSEFSTSALSADLLIEINYFPYPKQKHVMNSSNITPFAFLGIGSKVYTPELGDPSEVGDGGVTMSIPMGVGVRWLFSEHWGLQVQFKASKLFVDDFDSFQLDDPYELGNAGLHTNDWYYLTTFMFTYSFGKDIWDCNCPAKRKRH